MSRVLHPGIRFVASLAVACFLAVQNARVAAEAAPEDPNHVPLADAEKRLLAHIATIEAGEKALEAQFFDHAEDVLRAAFQKHGVSAEGIAARLKGLEGKVPSYMGAVSTRQTFYEAYTRILRASLKVVQDAGFADVEDLAYYDKRMAEWAEAEPQMREHIAAMLDLDGQLYALYEKRKALIGKGHDAELEALEEEEFAVQVKRSQAGSRFKFCMLRQYFTGFRGVGGKRSEKERIEKAAKEGEVLLPPEEAEKRLNALLLGMQLSLEEIEYEPGFWRYTDHDRGRFRREENSKSFTDWCESNGHTFDKKTLRFDDALEERLTQDFRYYHHSAVLSSLLAIRRAGVARQKDVEYLEKGVKAWEAKAAKFKAAFWKMKPLRKKILDQERELTALEEKWINMDYSRARDRFEEDFVAPARQKAEWDENKINEEIDEAYNDMFDVAYHTRVFHEAPNDDESGEEEGADEDEGP